MKELSNYARNITKKLDTMVKGSVSIVYDVKTDTLQVNIYTRQYGINIHINWDNVSNDFLNGVTSETIAKELFRIYKIKIFNLFIIC